MLHIDWDGITTLAYKTLIELKICSLPVPSTRVKIDGVIISSFQKYADITGLSLQDVTLGNEVNDALLVSGLREGLKIILYNKNKPDSRIKHSLWHEIGHIKCCHKTHGSQQEIEANFFSSQINAPNAIIREIARRGHKINTRSLMLIFGISDESARKKIDYLGRYSYEHTNLLDESITHQFRNFIDSKFPRNIQSISASYYDELEEERKHWQ